MTTLLPQNQPPPPSHPHHENLRTQDIPPAADHSNHISPTAMSSIPPPFPPANGINGSRLHQRQSGDFRAPAANGALTGANGNGPVPVPSIPHGRMANGHPTNMRSGGFDGPRSPPNNKSTSHVPCKFFRQGACQAGKACPFLHSTEPATDVAPCKYFQKGNCKFGAKCALAHILPDGRRVNRPNFGMGGGHLNLGGRINLHHNPDPVPGSSLLTMQAHMAAPQPQNYPYPMSDELYNQPGQMIPTIDTTFSSHPGSTYGSPRDDARLPLSPVQKGLSVLDAPLPASFDSQGISHVARYGPIAASVPSRFGLESSPPSSFQSRIGDSAALRNLHHSAFGDDKNGLASSPPVGEEPFGRRILHSERFSRPKMMSASLGARPPLGVDSDDDADENFAFEEDYVPNSLHELLTPQEKMRRFSRTANDDELHSLSHRNSLSGLGTPGDSSSKVGSPSRFGALFSRTHPKPTDGGEALSLPGQSAFGHVGSPLRNSSLNPGLSPSLRAMSRPASGDVSPFVSSPPRQASMSMISQQLQRARISSRAASTELLESRDSASAIHPGIARVASGSSVTSSPGDRSRLSIDRAVSSSSIGRERIEEEQGLFSMEEEEEMEKDKRKENSAGPVPKRYSGSVWGGFGLTSKASPSLGPIGGQRSSSVGKESAPWGTGT